MKLADKGPGVVRAGVTRNTDELAFLPAAIDIVAVAPGKIIPSGRTKVIQPFETGVVRNINVRDGQSVKLGDVLIELDPTMAGAELGHLRSDLMSARLEIARLRAALAG